ncbi:hypothetical protein BH10ACI2_BH10ACI2_02830 [soil metagenome]
MKLKLISLFILMICITAIVDSASAQLVPVYVSNAVHKTVLPPDAKGKWVIRGIVNLYKPSGENLVAEGLMNVEGGVLSGDLALKVGDSGYIKDNTVRITMTLSEPFKIGLRHDIALKPFLGRPMEYARFKNIPNAPYTSGNVIWDGVETPVSIFLGYEQVNAGTVAIRKPPPKPSTPIGARYQITGHIQIANAEDGVLDSTCEIYGLVRLIRFRNEKGEKIPGEPIMLFKIIEQDVMAGMDFKFPNNLFFDIYDDDKSEYRLDGSFFDRDKGQGLSGDDLMWPDPENPMRFDFRKYAGKGEYNYPGDRDSESVEVYLTVTKVSDLFKKP